MTLPAHRTMMLPVPMWAAAVGALVLLFVVRWLWRTMQPASGVDLLPDAPESAALFATKREAALVELVERHGKNFRMHLGGSVKGAVGMSTVFATADPAVVRTMLMKKVHTVKRPDRYYLARWLPFMDGVLFMDGPVWKRHTAALLPVFAPSNFNKFAPTMHRIAVRWLHEAVGGDEAPGVSTELEVLGVVKQLALDVLCNAGFGVDTRTPEALELRKALHAFEEVGATRAQRNVVLAIGAAMYNYWRCGLRVRAAFRNIVKAGTRCRIGIGSDGDLYKPSGAEVQAAQGASAAGGGADSGAGDVMTVTDLCGDDGGDAASTGRTHFNFLDRMVAAGLSESEIVSELNHINGAHKAFAVEFTFTLYELARRPEVIARMREEYAAALAAPEAVGREYVVREDTPRLGYCLAVMRECLRFHCISMGIMRDTGEPIKVDGVTIPKGTRVLMLMHAAHHLPEFWEAPLEFRPERWLKPDGRIRSGPRVKFSYFPFLEGQRQCQGRFLVEMEWLVSVHAILEHFDIALPEGYKLVKQPDFYPLPEDPIRVIFTRRARTARSTAAAAPVTAKV